MGRLTDRCSRVATCFSALTATVGGLDTSVRAFRGHIRTHINTVRGALTTLLSGLRRINSGVIVCSPARNACMSDGVTVHGVCHRLTIFNTHIGRITAGAISSVTGRHASRATTIKGLAVFGGTTPHMASPRANGPCPPVRWEESGVSAAPFGGLPLCSAKSITSLHSTCGHDVRLVSGGLRRLSVRVRVRRAASAHRRTWA